MLSTRPPLIALCGASVASPSQQDLALRVGRLIANRNAVGICGGLAGTMTEFARGMSEEGGTCLGFLPGSSAEDGNAFLTLAIPTGLGELRNGLIARAGAGMIAIGGGYGTLSEIAFARRLGKPVACLDSWGIEAPKTEPHDDGLLYADDPDHAVTWLWSQLEGMADHG